MGFCIGFDVLVRLGVGLDSVPVGPLVSEYHHELEEWRALSSDAHIGKALQP